MDLGQKMHVVRFAPKFEKGASPIRQNVFKSALQRVEKFRGEDFYPVLCHKNDMQLKGIDGMGSRFVRLIFHLDRGLPARANG